MNSRYSSVDRAKEFQSRREFNPLFLSRQKNFHDHRIKMIQFFSHTKQNPNRSIIPRKLVPKRLPALNRKMLSQHKYDIYTKTAAFELAAQGTRVNTICPGLVPTEILTLSNEMFSEDQLKETMYGRYPLKRVGTPEDIANGAIYLLSDASSWVTGINLVIDGGYTVV